MNSRRCLFWALILPLSAIAELDQGIVEPPESMRAYAEAGDPAAQHNLALSYQKGIDGKPDMAAAIRWYKKAAEAGFPQAQYNLAVLLAVGEGVPKDEKLALKWFYAAAAQGIFPAQKALIECYARGLGVEKNAEKALAWDFLARRTLELRFDQAAGTPPKPARLRPDGLAEFMTPDGLQAIGEDGHLEKIAEDGTRRIDNADGSHTEIYKSGEKKTFFPDGGFFTEYPDGKTVARDRRGTMETRMPDGTRILEGEATTSKGERTRAITTFDKNNKQVSQRFLAEGKWMEKLADGTLLMEIEGEDEEGRKIRVTDRFDADGNQGDRRIVRVKDGVERKGDEVWTVRYSRQLPDGSIAEVKEKFGLGGSSWGVEILSVKAPPKEVADRGEPVVMPAKQVQTFTARSVIMEVAPPQVHTSNMAVVGGKDPGGRDLFRKKVAIDTQLEELAAIERRARYFAGATEAQYEKARNAARLFVFTLPATPQKKAATTWLSKRLDAMAAPPAPPPLREIPSDRSDAYPLGLYGREIIKKLPWKHAETEHFVVHYRDSADAYPVMRNIEGAFFVVTQTLQIDTTAWRRKSHVFVFPDKERWNAFTTAHDIPSLVAGFAYKDELLFGAVNQGDEYIKLLSHEATHAIVARFYPGRSWPLWMNEGFADYMAAKWLALRGKHGIERHLNAGAGSAIEVDRVFDRLQYGIQSVGGNDVSQFYAQSEKCVQTLLEKLPLENFPRFANLLMAENPPAVALKGAYGNACPDTAAFAKLVNPAR